MTRTDVIVVGGGPAGSSCAHDLVRAGARVTVLDRATFPRDKCCAGWITPHVVGALGLDADDYARGRTLQPITGFVTSAMARSRVRTDFGCTVSYAIRRCEFDHYLLERSHADLELGASVLRIERVRDRWVIDERIEAPMLVGAGGHFCPVARLLNPGYDDGPVVVAQECEFQMTPRQVGRCRVDADLPELYFCSDRRGYGWSVRKGDYLNVGFGRLRDPDGEFPKQVDKFREFLRSEQRVPDDMPPKWPGHAYRIYASPMRTVVAEGALLVGDAAGLAHPVSGEGILTAVESGRLAARTIVESDGGRLREHLELYRRRLQGRYGETAPQPRERPSVGDRLVSALGVHVMGVRWFARRVLLERWFLHTSLPVLQV